MIAVLAGEIFGIPFVNNHLVSPLDPYVDAVAGAILGNQGRTVDTEGDAVILPCVVVISFGNEAAVGLCRIC